MKNIISTIILIFFSLLSYSESEVPEMVLKKYKNSFVYSENGIIRGAKIGKLYKYLSREEIETIFKKDFDDSLRKSGLNIDDGGINYIIGFKPKSGGCRKNKRWVCSIYSIVKDE